MCEQADARKELVAKVNEWQGPILEGWSRLSLVRDWLQHHEGGRLDAPPHVLVDAEALDGAAGIVDEVARSLHKVFHEMGDVTP